MYSISKDSFGVINQHSQGLLYTAISNTGAYVCVEKWVTSYCLSSSTWRATHRTTSSRLSIFWSVHDVLRDFTLTSILLQFVVSTGIVPIEYITFYLCSSVCSLTKGNILCAMRLDAFCCDMDIPESKRNLAANCIPFYFKFWSGFHSDTPDFTTFFNYFHVNAFLTLLTSLCNSKYCFMHICESWRFS